MLGTLLVWAASPLDVSVLTAFAAPHAQQDATPTPESYWISPTRDPNMYAGYETPTMTPTPYGGINQINQNPYNQYPNNQVPNNQFPNNQVPNSQFPYNAPGQGGMSNSSIQPGSGPPPPGAASPAPNGSDPCYGDELITLAPDSPRVGDELLIAVTSSHPHPFGRLAGTENTRFTRERPGQRGYVWEWVITPTYPGQHEYTFYVDSTIPCQKIQVTVRESLATKTPRPTKTPTPYGWNSNDNNNNDNNNGGNNGSVPYRDPYQFTYSGDAYNCSFFYSQGEAQRVLRANPADPNRLDSEDGVTDGIACTTYHNWQYPNDGDYNPVSTNGTGTQTGNVPYRDPYQYANVNNDQYNCNFFYSQGESQRVLRANPNDPNQLDTENGGNRDGVACTNYSGWQYPNDVDYNAVIR